MTDGGKHLFLIEMDDAPDALLRALGPFALHDFTVTGLGLTRHEDRLELRVEAAGADRVMAAHIGRKLDALPIVRGVGLGWRA